MCVDKHHYKCCGSCSLTTATLILGALYLLGTIAYAVTQQWVSFSISLILTLLFVMVLVKPGDIGVRKLIFYLVTIGQIIGTVALILVFIILMATDDWVKDACDKWDVDNCYDDAKKWIIISFIIALILDLLLCFCVAQILYYGWKEQEALAVEGLAYGNQGGAAQVYNAPYQPAAQAYQPAPQGY